MPRILTGAFALALVLPATAFAHAILMSSLPPLGGHAPAGDVAVSLHYNSLIDVERSRLSLIAPDRGETRLKITGTEIGDTILAHLTVPPGPVLLRWQVLAIDGHITRGDVPFTADPAPKAR